MECVCVCVFVCNHMSVWVYYILYVLVENHSLSDHNPCKWGGNVIEEGVSTWEQQKAGMMLKEAALQKNNIS